MARHVNMSMAPIHFHSCFTSRIFLTEVETTNKMVVRHDLYSVVRTRINHLEIYKCTPFSGNLGGALCLEFTTSVFFGNSCHSCFLKFRTIGSGHCFIRDLKCGIAPSCSRIFANFDGTSRDIGPAFNQGSQRTG